MHLLCCTDNQTEVTREWSNRSRTSQIIPGIWLNRILNQLDQGVKVGHSGTALTSGSNCWVIA